MSVSFVRTLAFQSSFSPNLWIAKHGPFSSAFHRVFTRFTAGYISFFLSKVSPLAFDFALLPLFDPLLWLFPIILSVQSNRLLWTFFFFFNCNLCYLGVSPLVGSCPLKGFFFFLQEKLGWILFTALCSFLQPLPLTATLALFFGTKLCLRTVQTLTHGMLYCRGLMNACGLNRPCSSLQFDRKERRRPRELSPQNCKRVEKEGGGEKWG